MTEQVILALILAIPAMVASAVVPTVVLWMNNNQVLRVKEVDDLIRKQEREAENKRADELEARRKKESDEVARLLKDNTAVVVATTGETQGQLQQIHSLVNSHLTKEMEARLAVMQTGLVSLIEIVDLRKSLGQPENQVSRAQMGLMQKEIEQLKSILEARRAATEAAASEQRSTATATKAAVAALTASGPLAVNIQQEDTNPVPVKQADVI